MQLCDVLAALILLPPSTQFYARRKMRRRRRRGSARKSLELEDAGLPSVTLESVGHLRPQEERREETSTNCHVKRRQDGDEGSGLRRLRTWKTEQGVKPISGPLVKEKSRLRSIKFSNIENMTLISKLVPVYEQLLGKRKSRTPFFKKCQMWREICDAVNVVGNKQRFVHHCKKRFYDMKRKLRCKMNQEQSLLGDQGGSSPYQVYYTQYEEELKSVLPAEVIDGIEFFDSDHPQELDPAAEAGPSWCTLENGQKLPMEEKSSRELQNVSIPEGLQRKLYIGSLHDQWSMLPDLCSTFPVDPSSVRPMNFYTEHIDLQPGHTVNPRKPKLHSSGYSIEQPSSPNLPNMTRKHGARVLKVLKATQKLFQKSMVHSLNVLHLDVRYFNQCLEESNSVADNLLRVEGERNSTLHQMNIQLGKLAESLEQLANQQQAERILRHDFPRRGGRIGGSCQTGEVRRSLNIASSAMTCLSEQGFMLGTPP